MKKQEFETGSIDLNLVKDKLYDFVKEEKILLFLYFPVDCNREPIYCTKPIFKQYFANMSGIIETAVNFLIYNLKNEKFKDSVKIVIQATGNSQRIKTGVIKIQDFVSGEIIALKNIGVGNELENNKEIEFWLIWFGSGLKLLTLSLLKES